MAQHVSAHLSLMVDVEHNPNPRNVKQSSSGNTSGANGKLDNGQTGDRVGEKIGEDVVGEGDGI